MAHGYSASAGMVEHAKLFMETAENLAQQLNMGILLVDFSGNGLSDGYFHQMTPNRRIAEAIFLLDHIAASFTGKLFLLGLSMGGAVSVHAAGLRESRLSGLITWSCVPSFDPAVPSAHWYPAKPDAGQCESPGPDFYTDRPQRSIADVYTSLRLPKLQIQGDQDFAHFAEEFRSFFDLAHKPKRLVLLPGGDHVFTDRDTRTTVIAETTGWLEKLV